MEQRYKSVALDGPSGAGKSTLAQMLAQELGFLYVDTGAIYRTVGLYVHEQGVDPADGEAVSKLLRDIQIELAHGQDGLQHMLLNGTDVTDKIRLPEMSHYASQVSAIPQVRAFLFDIQRQLARRHNVVMDGRDIGTVVLPDADVKIFLTASLEERARRRCAELRQRGTPVPYETVRDEMKKRDEQDSNRAVAPLKQAEDAIRVETTGNTVEKSFRVLCKIIKGRLKP